MHSQVFAGRSDVGRLGRLGSPNQQDGAARFFVAQPREPTVERHTS